MSYKEDKMRIEKYLYWTYFLSEQHTVTDIIPGFFNVSEYSDKYLFLHVKAGISFNFQQDKLLDRLAQYTFEISKEEEDYILDDMGINGKKTYACTLKELGLGDDYLLYAVSLSTESVKLIQQLVDSLK